MRKFLLVQKDKSTTESPSPLRTIENVAIRALTWLMTEDDDNRSLVFEVFPELTPDAIIEEVFLLWGDLADRGSFRDAVEDVFLQVPEENREKARPRVWEIFASREYSTGARALAYQVMQSWWGNVEAPALADEEMRAIEIDFFGDCGFSKHGSVENVSSYLASLMWDPDDGESRYAFVERIRQRAGMPYAFAHCHASLDSAPWHGEILRRLSATGCRTTEYLLRLAHCDARQRALRPEEMVTAEVAKLIDEAARACFDGPSAETVREEWFQSAEFWFSPADTWGDYVLAAWMATPRPGGTHAYVLLGVDGVVAGRCERSVPECAVPDELMDRPLASIDAQLALTLIRAGFATWAEKHPPDSLNPRSGPGAAFDAALYIENAAVQMLCAHPAQDENGSVELVRPDGAVCSPSKLAALLESNAYRAWYRPRDLANMIQSALDTMDWRSDLQRRLLEDIGRARLIAACRRWRGGIATRATTWRPR